MRELCELYRYLKKKACASLSLLNSRQAQTQQLFPKVCLCQNQRSELPSHPLVCTNKKQSIYLSVFNSRTETCWPNQTFSGFQLKMMILPADLSLKKITFVVLVHRLEISQVNFCNISQTMFSDLQIRFEVLGYIFWCQQAPFRNHVCKLWILWI